MVRRDRVETCLGQSRNVADIVFGISDALNIDGLGLVVDGSGERFRGSLCNPFYANAKVLERHYGQC